MNHLFNRKTEAFFGSLRHLGYPLLLAGLLLGSNPWWRSGETDPVQMLAVGGMLVLLGLLFRFTYHGFQIDFQNARLREYLSMFGFKSGKWAPWPAFRRVELTSNLKPAHYHGHQHAGQPTAPPVTWYTIGLYSGSEEADFELRTDNGNDARTTLQLLAERLGIPAEDKTQPLDPFSSR